MKRKQYIFGILAGLYCCACTLDIPYENQFSDPDAVATVEAARELLANAYTTMPNPEFDLSVLADDFESTYLISKNTSLSYLYSWQPSAFETLAYTLWQGYYAAIANANMVLERLPGVVCTTAEEEVELGCIESEAKVLKAWCYFDLLRLFAVTPDEGEEMPGIVLKDKLEMAELSRSSVGACIGAIRDLLSESLLLVREPDEVYWLGNLSAEYLLAELELYAGNYRDAAAHAAGILETKGYDVMTEDNYRNLWSDSESEERIFALYTTQSFYSDLNYDWEKGDYLVVNPDLVESFAPGDLRGEESIYWFRMPGQVIGDTADAANLGKYNRMLWEQEEVRYINKFRVAGVCLLLAEAYCRDNDSRAVDVMNRYLAQRGAPLLDEGLSGETLLRAILDEKHKEFVGEGVRYFDLKRCRKEVLNGWDKTVGRNIANDDYRWTFPIPKEEYLYNNYMEQNEGWTKIEL